MTRPAFFILGALALVVTAGCAPKWKHEGGRQALSPGLYNRPAADGEAGKSYESRRVSFAVPGGWHWYVRGQDLIATRDGVFLQHIFLERIHVGQSDQAVMGAFPFSAMSSKQWPVRTAKSLKKRFAAGMLAPEAAEVLLDSRRNDPAVTDLSVRKVDAVTLAGQPAFRAEFDFRLKDPLERGQDAVGPFPPYRSVYCGFVLGEWFYGVGYTAAARYYFERDAGTFDNFLESVRIVDE